MTTSKDSVSTNSKKTPGSTVATGRKQPPLNPWWGERQPKRALADSRKSRRHQHNREKHERIDITLCKYVLDLERRK